MLLVTRCGLILLYLPYKEYHTRHGIRHLPYKQMFKIRHFTSTKWPPDFARLINHCIIIYNNNSGMTVKPVYIQIILLPNILWHFVDAAFLIKPLESTAAYSVFDVNKEVNLTIQKLASQPSNSLNIVNLAPNNRIPFSSIMFFLLCTPWIVYKLFNSISVWNVCICHLP